MKLTDEYIQQFEKEQKDCGTRVALFNIFWNSAADIFRDIGIVEIVTKTKEDLDDEAATGIAGVNWAKAVNELCEEN